MMLTAIIVIGLCGVAGGWFMEHAALLADRRDRWARKRDVAAAALHDELDDLATETGFPFGLIAIDLEVLPEIPTGPLSAKERRRLKRVWFWAYLGTCSACSGVHFVWAFLVVWAVWAYATNTPPPVSWAESVPTLGAGIAVHLIVTRIGDKADLW